MRVDYATVCRLMQAHLDEHGTSSTVFGAEIRVDGLKLRFRSAGADDDDAPASLFWVDIDGLRLRPPMQLDLSGWGTSADEAAMDAAHGMLESILPPLRWLAQEPWHAPEPTAGAIQHIIGDGEIPWTIVLGRPWVVVAATQGGVDVTSVADRLRERLIGGAAEEFRELGTWPGRLTVERRGHWFKVYAVRMPDGMIDGRIDIDNDVSITADDFARTLPWQAGDTLQIVRQLIVMRPDGEGRRETPGRLARLFGRSS